jgi:hypothetical protein
MWCFTGCKTLFIFFQCSIRTKEKNSIYPFFLLYSYILLVLCPRRALTVISEVSSTYPLLSSHENYLLKCYGLATKTGMAARMARRRAVLDCVACVTLIPTFVSVAGRAAVRRSPWLDKYIAMRLFQSLNASPFAPRQYSHRRMSCGQAVRW